jgi:hypothetical protein
MQHCFVVNRNWYVRNGMMNFPCEIDIEWFVFCRAKSGAMLLIGTAGAMRTQGQYGRPTAGTDKMMQV